MLLNNLSRIVGSENVKDSRLDFLAYSYDASQKKGDPLCVVLPGTVDEVLEVVKLCHKYGYNIAARGGGTGFSAGAVPNREVVLDTARLDRIKVVVSEKKAVVGAGVVLRHLNKILALQNLFFPIVPLSETACTIGGMVATNANGSRSLKFGRMIAWVESLKVVTGNAEVVETRDVKDFCGMEGVSGIIVEATLKLSTPLGKTSVTLREFESLKDLVSALKDLRQLSHVIDIVLLNKQAGELIGFENNILIVEYEGEGGEITEESEVANILRKSKCVYHELALRGLSVVTDPSVGIDKMFELLSWLEDNDIPCFGGVGVVHACFSQNQDYVIEDLFERVIALGGVVGGVHGFGVLKKKYVDSRLKNKVRDLRMFYNRKNIINRGRIV